uniref:Uncharacterized protein n=1 Tax=Pyrodinium bahamense TaxID=73915 RepID=A0A7S0AGT4_9DINO|mmetsp:Transcript_34314/g.94804  ORF Transcript_34314/g.94804 Transcript_34314/m.94804 type:complete len:216 (+) Transcript_34314:78-725(+)
MIVASGHAGLLTAALGVLWDIVTAGASDPCFAVQSFGHGFDVVVGGGDDALTGAPPRLEAGNLVVQVECDAGCTRADFRPRVREHGSRGGLCAVWLELEAEAAQCTAGFPRRTSQEVRVPLPAGAHNCSTLLFAFPPGQRYEYFRLTDPAVPGAALAPWIAAQEPEEGTGEAAEPEATEAEPTHSATPEERQCAARRLVSACASCSPAAARGPRQ